jgi:hypothetical protein
MNKQSVITKEIGNVTKDTEITFEFGLREGNILLDFFLIIAADHSFFLRPFNF